MAKIYTRKKDDPTTKETPDYLGPDAPEVKDTVPEDSSGHNFPRYKLRTFPDSDSEKHNFPRYKLRTSSDKP